MAVSRGRYRPAHRTRPSAKVSPQEEQVIRMRQGASVSNDQPLALAASPSSDVGSRLLALEASIMARAPKVQPEKRLRLVMGSREDLSRS